jgi:hypothetical protein
MLYDAPGLGGTQSVAAVHGVATFSHLTISKASSAWNLTNLVLASPGLNPVMSNNFKVTSATATQLVLSAPLGNVLDRVPFKLLVSAEDQYGNVDNSFNGTVTIALDANPAGATLGGNRSATAVGGAAIFSNLTLDKVGSGYTLKATSDRLTSATPSPLDVAAARSSDVTSAWPFNVTSDQLSVTVQPPGGLPVGASFGFTVVATDSAGHIDRSFNGDVTASLITFPDTRPGAATLRGTLTVTAKDGVAIFSGLTLDRVGQYELSVVGRGIGQVATGPVNTDTGLSTLKSSMKPLPATEPPSFKIEWSGDAAGGEETASYRVYVSDNGGPFRPIEIDTQATSATFHGEAGHTYAFYSWAKDTIGNVEATTGQSQAATRIVAGPAR